MNQEINKVLEDKINKTANFHRLKKSMGEYVDTFQSVFKVYQRYIVTQNKRPLEENENLPRCQNRKGEV